MSYVAITFPISTGTDKQRKNESLRKANQFSKQLGLKPGVDVELTLIREGTYGLVLPSDLDDEVLQKAKKLGGKVSSFVESATPKAKINEGSWIKLDKAAPGIRFMMTGTSASNPQEGKILPGSYYVLGIEESNGGRYATLGKVDKLHEIGRDGKGRYTYNIDLDTLSAVISTPAVKQESKTLKESKNEDATEIEENDDRSQQILDMLLENDPGIHKVKQKEAKLEAAKKAGETVDLSIEDLVAISMQEVTGETPVIVESTEAAETTTEEDNASEENAEDTTEEETSKDEVKAEAETDEIDPDLYLESRQIVQALEEAGHDVEKMTENELTDAILALSKDEETQTSETTQKSEDVIASTEDSEEDKTDTVAGEDSDEAFETKES